MPNLLTGFWGPDNEVPYPENATYDGGGGGTYVYDVLSERLTDNPPFGYYFLNFSGTFPLFNYFMNYLFPGSL